MLLDHCVPEPIGAELPRHDVVHASRVGWEELDNGRLLRAARDAGFQVVLTADRNMQYQQNPAALPLPVVVLRGRTNSIEHLIPLLPEALALLDSGELEHRFYLISWRSPT